MLDMTIQAIFPRRSSWTKTHSPREPRSNGFCVLTRSVLQGNRGPASQTSVKSQAMFTGFSLSNIICFQHWLHVFRISLFLTRFSNICQGPFYRLCCSSMKIRNTVNYTSNKNIFHVVLLTFHRLSMKTLFCSVIVSTS